jgi:hypothetical protein
MGEMVRWAGEALMAQTGVVMRDEHKVAVGCVRWSCRRQENRHDDEDEDEADDDGRWVVDEPRWTSGYGIG